MASYYEPDYYVKELMKSVEERIKNMTDESLKVLEKKAQELQAKMK